VIYQQLLETIRAKGLRVTDGMSTNIEKSKLPKGAKVGDILNIDGDTITVDIAETEARKKKVAALVDELFD